MLGFPDYLFPLKKGREPAGGSGHRFILPAAGSGMQGTTVALHPTTMHLSFEFQMTGSANVPEQS
jgi:hypothetical protein